MSRVLTPSALRGAARKEKGGSPEDARQKDIHMAQVALREADSNISAAQFSTISTHRKMAIQIDHLVAEAARAGKPVAQMIQLTPVLAEVLLTRNPANRKLNESAVDRYAYEIIGNRWVFNGEPLIVSDAGDLNDGQHRCAAVVKAGLPIDVILIVGVPRESRTTLDQGKMRTAADYLSMEGQTNTIVLAAAANYAWQYRNRGMLAFRGRDKATKSEILDFVAENPGLERSTALFTLKNSRLLGGVAFMTFCHFAISGAGKTENADTLFISLVEGGNLGVVHPALYLRNRLMGMTGGRDINGKAELVFKAWNAWRRGEKVERLNIIGGTLPALEA